MPTFDWNIDPVAFEIPRTLLVIVLGFVGVMIVITAFTKKEAGSAVGGLALIGLAWLITQVMGESLQIRYYSLLFVGVFLGGYALLNWQVRRGGGSEEVAGDFIVYGVLGVLVGSRLGHVLFYDLDKAIKDPIWVLKIWTGGLASHGAVLGLIAAMFLFTRSRGVPFLEGADRFSFSAALGATLVRLGNFFNSEIVGRETDGTWGVRFLRFDGPNAPLRHPSQLYEVTLGLVVLGSLYVADRAMGREKRPRGALISLFFTIYFAGRFCVEYVKEYQTLERSSPFTMGQILSMPGFALGVVGLIYSFKKREPVGWPSEEHELEEAGDEEEEEQDEEPEEDDDERSDETEDENAASGDPDVDSEFDEEDSDSDESDESSNDSKKD